MDKRALVITRPCWDFGYATCYCHEGAIPGRQMKVNEWYYWDEIFRYYRGCMVATAAYCKGAIEQHTQGDAFRYLWQLTLIRVGWDACRGKHGLPLTS